MNVHYFKKMLLGVASILAANLCALAQTSINFEKASVSFDRDPGADKTAYLNIVVNGTLQVATGMMALGISRNDAPAAYSLGIANFTIQPLTASIAVPIQIVRGKPSKAADTLVVNFTDILNGAVRTVTITINAVKEPEEQADKSRIMFLNAYNFDFGSTSLGSNYVGHLNFFAPHFKSTKWGFNTGIMKINYGQKDTSNSTGRVVKENFFINALDTIRNNLSYLREANSYKTERRNTIWSFYVQPTYELTSGETEQHIFLHFHIELVASKWSSTTTTTNLARDTSVLQLPVANGFIIRSRLGNDNTYTINALSGYFGGGVTYDLKPWKGGSFFFQPTIGVTSNQPSVNSVDINSGIPSVPKNENQRTWTGFYLFRAYYTHQISKESTGVFGVDIRGLLPTYAPQYAAYVGLNLSLNSILGLVGLDKK